MRDPDNLHKFYEYADDVPDVIKLPELPPFNIPDYDLNDEKEFKKYISNIEKVVRESFEYKRMVSYLRDYLDMNKCSFYENISNADTTKIRIEIHHEPLSLYDICLTVYQKRVTFHESLEVEMVAKEVMYHHYAMQVGLIPLAETVHELVHNQYLFIPSTKVYGNYKKFVQEYEPYMPPECIDSLKRIEELTSTYEAEEYQQLLSKKFIYIDPTGAYDLPKLEDVAGMLKSHIRDSMNNEIEMHQVPQNEQKQYHSPIIFEN